MSLPPCPVCGANHCPICGEQHPDLSNLPDDPDPGCDWDNFHPVHPEVWFAGETP